MTGYYHDHYLWEESGLNQLFNEMYLETVSFLRTPSVRGVDEIWLGYVLRKSE